MSERCYAREGASGPLSPVFGLAINGALFILRGRDGFGCRSDALRCQPFELDETGVCGPCRGRYPSGELDASTGRCGPCQAAYDAAHPPCQHARAKVVHPSHGSAYRRCPDCGVELPLATGVSA